MDEAFRYRLVVAWSDEDQEFIVTVPELPGCRTSGETYEAAIAMAQDAIGTWLDVARDDGRPIPAPQTFDYDADTEAAWPGSRLPPEQRAEATRRLLAKAMQDPEPAAA